VLAILDKIIPDALFWGLNKLTALRKKWINGALRRNVRARTRSYAQYDLIFLNRLPLVRIANSTVQIIFFVKTLAIIDIYRYSRLCSSLSFYFSWREVTCTKRQVLGLICGISIP
jgi:hypothetical protein